MKTIATNSASETGHHSMGDNVAVWLVHEGISITTVNGGLLKVGSMVVQSPLAAHFTVHSDVSEIKADGLEYLKGTNIKVEDFFPEQYTYNGSAWATNSNWVATVRDCHQFNSRTNARCTGTITDPAKNCSVCGVLK